MQAARCVPINTIFILCSKILPTCIINKQSTVPPLLVRRYGKRNISAKAGSSSTQTVVESFVSNFGLYFQKLGGQTASPGESSKGSRLLYYILFSMTTIVEHSLAQPTLNINISIKFDLTCV